MLIVVNSTDNLSNADCLLSTLLFPTGTPVYLEHSSLTLCIPLYSQDSNLTHGNPSYPVNSSLTMGTSVYPEDSSSTLEKLTPV